MSVVYFCISMHDLCLCVTIVTLFWVASIAERSPGFACSLWFTSETGKDVGHHQAPFKFYSEPRVTSGNSSVGRQRRVFVSLF